MGVIVIGLPIPGKTGAGEVPDPGRLPRCISLLTVRIDRVVSVAPT
jgi:hypothetical protein